jgi:hypothetical protein
MFVFSMLLAAAALAPLGSGPAPKGGLRAKSGGLRPAGLALDQEPDKPVKEITKDMFGTKYKGGQAEMCSQYLIPIVAGIVAGIVKVCTKAQGLMYMLLDAISFTGSVFAFLTLFLVFGNAHNGTRLWDQYDNDESYGGLDTSCFWVVVFAVWQVMQCACLCCCAGLLVTAAVATPHPTVFKMMDEIEKTKQERDFNKATGKILESCKSPEFKKKCEDMFKEADKNGDGSLDASELRSFAAFSLPECVNDELFYEAFDKNGDKKLDAEEFYNMMTYFEMKKRLKAGDY